MPSENVKSPTTLGKRNRRTGWVYLNVVFAMFLALAALAACVDDGGDDEVGGGTDATEESAGTDDAADDDEDAVAVDDGEPLNVAVTMPFMPSMVDAVGGDHVEIESIVPVGVDVHTYQPTPGDAQLIADADIIFVNGLGFEEFLDDLIESAGGVDAPVFELADGLQDEGIESDSHEHEDEHADDDHDHDEHEDEHEDEHADDDHDHDEHEDEHADDDHDHDEHENEHADDDHDHDEHEDELADDDHDHDEHEDEHEDEHADDDHDHDNHDHDHDHDWDYGNPHFWLSPSFGVHYVENIYEGLAEVDSANEETYRANSDDYIAEIEEFDEWAQEEMAGIPDDNRFMVTFHDAFPHFANHYGLEIVGVVVTSPGREPGAQEVAQLADQIQDVGVPAVFIEPQFNPSLAEAIADEAGVQTVTIFSGTPPEGTGYLEMMELNVARIVEALR